MEEPYVLSRAGWSILPRGGEKGRGGRGETKDGRRVRVSVTSFSFFLPVAFSLRSQYISQLQTSQDQRWPGTTPGMSGHRQRIREEHSGG